jgi:hypothetical protein
MNRVVANSTEIAESLQPAQAAAPVGYAVALEPLANLGERSTLW